MKFKNAFFLSLLTLFIASCSTDDEEKLEPGSSYENGIFVLNEGIWGEGNASVSFVSNDLEEIEQNIFSSNNVDMALGDVAQDLGLYEDLAFIVLNASNKIEVVDRTTFESVATIDTRLSNPRYISFANGKAYVTNWGDGNDPDDDYVAVFDADSFDFLKEIPVAEGPEKIISEGDQVFVAHAGGYSFNDQVSVIETGDDTVTEELTVGFVPNSLVVSGGNLLVLSSGVPAYPEDIEESAGSFSRIDLSTLEVTTFDFPEATDHPSYLREDNGQFYFVLDKEVYSFSSSAAPSATGPILSLTEEAGSLYSFEVEDGQIFVGFTSPDYTGNGTLKVYNIGSNEPVETFTTGIGPNGIFFNE